MGEKWDKVKAGSGDGTVPAAEYAEAAIAIISVSAIRRASRFPPVEDSIPPFALPSDAHCVLSDCYSPA